MRLFLIEWEDASTRSGWQWLEDIKEDTNLLMIRSVGWVVYEDKNQLILGSHISGERNKTIQLGISDCMSIPKSSIIKMIRLKGGELK